MNNLLGFIMFLLGPILSVIGAALILLVINAAAVQIGFSFIRVLLVVLMGIFLIFAGYAMANTGAER